MARQKQYKEVEVLEKAMNLFWRNGYETTSMQMLEKEMGINKFSIYSSFGSKNGLFLESLKCYKLKLKEPMDKLKESKNGITGVKQYFNDFLDFSKENDLRKGCLVTNTANELGSESDAQIKEALMAFTDDVKALFTSVLKEDTRKREAAIAQQADYLLISMFGLSSASRVFSQDQLNNYIEHIFKNI